jgi:hypothetical protein
VKKNNPAAERMAANKKSRLHYETGIEYQSGAD